MKNQRRVSDNQTYRKDFNQAGTITYRRVFNQVVKEFNALFAEIGIGIVLDTITERSRHIGFKLVEPKKREESPKGSSIH